VTFIFVVSGTTTGAPPGDYQASGSLWDVIGAGGSGATGNPGSDSPSGGAGGGWSQILNITWASAQTCQIGAGGAARSTNTQAGAAGTDTWARIDGGAVAPTTTTQGVLAKGGGGGLVTGAVAGGVGGAAASGVGTNKFSGGNGGSSNDASTSAGAGGGAAGPGGNGGTGGNDTASGATVSCGTGGGANGGGGAGTGIAGTTATIIGRAGGASITTGNQTGASGGAGGAANAAGTAGTNGAGGGGGGGSSSATAAGKGGDGGPGKEYDSSHGSGGGGGSGGGNQTTSGSTSFGGTGGTGGLYGGGGGAAGSVSTGATPTNPSGAGAIGLLTINYTPASAVAVSSPLQYSRSGPNVLRTGPKSMATTNWTSLATNFPVAEAPVKLIQRAISPSATSATPTSTSLNFTNIVRNNGGVLGCVAWFTTTNTEVVTITDDAGNTYTQRARIYNSTDHVATVHFDLLGITNFPRTITATFGSGVGYQRVLIEEWSGLVAVDGTPVGAASVSAAVSANTISSGNTTPLFNGDLIWGVTTETKGNQNATASPGSGFTLGTSSVITDVQYMNAENIVVQSTAAAISATFTPDQTVTDWITQVGAYKTVSSTGGPVVGVVGSTLAFMGVG